MWCLSQPYLPTQFKNFFSISIISVKGLLQPYHSSMLLSGDFIRLSWFNGFNWEELHWLLIMSVPLSKNLDHSELPLPIVGGRRLLRPWKSTLVAFKSMHILEAPTDDRATTTDEVNADYKERSVLHHETAESFCEFNPRLKRRYFSVLEWNQSVISRLSDSVSMTAAYFPINWFTLIFSIDVRLSFCST